MQINCFKRTEILIGTDGLQRLQCARVTVVGLGAVGSFATECLVRSGIGNLRLIDFDVLHETNINRQLFALPSVIGQKKTSLAAQRVNSINPRCNVVADELFINAESAAQAVDDRPDILIDAIDSLNPKTCLLHDAHENGVIVVSAMGAATRTDPTAVRIADLSKTYNCPLAKFVRKRLARRGIRTGICCVFSCEPPNRTAISAQTDMDASEVRAAPGQGRPRNTLGSFCSIPAIFGLTAAQQAIKLILEDPDDS
jgi:tRNA A37 threonylcarbamoyladenosine dehydratase